MYSIKTLDTAFCGIYFIDHGVRLKLQFIYFFVLWLVPLFATAATVAFLKRMAPRRTLVLQTLAGFCILLALAGLHYRHAIRAIQIVVATDVSPSIFELNAQTARVREVLGALDPESTEAAVVVFSATAALERSMSPLPPLTPVSSQDERASTPAVRRNSLPDFAHLHAVVNTHGTDISVALQAARAAFTSTTCSRAIVLQSDFRDTTAPDNRNALRTAAFLRDSGIDLLATPSILGPSSDVQLAELRVPDTATAGRNVPIDITLAAHQPATVLVNVWRRSTKDKPVLVGTQTVTLAAAPNANTSAEIRKTIRLVDHPNTPGVAVYSATLSGPDGPIPGDVLLNNSLSAAVRISGPSKWAVLAPANSTLAKLALDSSKPLGVETSLFLPEHLPTDPSAYDPFSGILVDGFSADEFPDSSSSLRALTRAVESGKALVAIGGENAFGAGGHRSGGEWEKLLPIEMTPEDDRARAILVIIDVSKSMDDTLVLNGARVRKMDFAAEKLQAVSALRPQDRVGLIEFSGTAKLSAPLSNDPAHSAFLNAIHAIHTDTRTDILHALTLAQQTLEADDADEKLVILISDGVDTSGRPSADIVRAAEKLCEKLPTQSTRKTTLWTFGIGVGSEAANTTGETVLKNLAAVGNGQYTRDFLNFGDQFSKTLEQGKKEFFTRREPFAPRASQPHSLIPNNVSWPTLQFRNRVKSKSDADSILTSGPAISLGGKSKNKADPVLILSGPSATGLARRAVLALSLDGENGASFLSENSPGRTLPAGVLSWAEARDAGATSGVTLSVESFGTDELSIELRALDSKTGEPDNTLNPRVMLTVLQTAERKSTEDVSTVNEFELKATAPGTYRGTMPAPPSSVCRLSVLDAGRTISERFVGTPCAAEFRNFGVDRAAMAGMISAAGPGARVIESPRDLAAWAAEKSGASGISDLRVWLIALALGLLLFDYGTRGKAAQSKR